MIADQKYLLTSITSSQVNVEIDSHIYSQGLWTVVEQEQFKEGLFLFGRRWKLVQGLITSRSITQCKSHSQKFFRGIKVKFMKDIKKEWGDISEFSGNLEDFVKNWIENVIFNQFEFVITKHHNEKNFNKKINELKQNLFKALIDSKTKSDETKFFQMLQNLNPKWTDVSDSEHVNYSTRKIFQVKNEKSKEKKVELLPKGKDNFTYFSEINANQIPLHTEAYDSTHHHNNEDHQVFNLNCSFDRLPNLTHHFNYEENLSYTHVENDTHFLYLEDQTKGCKNNEFSGYFYK